MSGPVLSVVVCTHDRPGFLRRALGSLVAQTLPPEAFEIVVVDNGPDGAAASVVAEPSLAADAPRIVLVRECRVGLGRARNAGVAASRGRYVAFIDDDATAAPDWLERALEAFESNEPAPVAVGGPVEAVFETPPPRWFREEWERRSHGPAARYLEPGESFSGSNMVIARGTILECGGFDESVGMRGNTIGTGEETQLFHAIRLADGAAGLYYDPSLRVEHPVAPYKVSARYQLKRVFADAQSRERARRLTRRESLRSLPRCAASLVRGVTSALLALPRYRDLRVWAVERLGDAARSLGRMHAALGLRGGMSQSAYDRPQERPEPLQGESPEQT